MAQTVLRIERGLFSGENVFSSIKRDEIYRYLMDCVEKGEFTQRPHVHDVGLERHPLWMEKFDPNIQANILEFINSTNIPSLFMFPGSISVESISASFVLYYSKREQQSATSSREALSIHQDISLIPGMHILSTVYTLKSHDCIGGSLAYSNKWDGSQKDSRDMTNFDPKDNSVYCLNGDHVSHSAYGVSQGVRFAIVLFINTPQTDMDVSVLWNWPNEDPETFCTICFKGFSNKKQKKRHMDNCEEKVV